MEAISSPIRMIDEKIKWNERKIEEAKAKIEYHTSEIKRLNNGIHNEKTLI